VDHVVTCIAQRPRQNFARSRVVVDDIYFTPEKAILRHVLIQQKIPATTESEIGDRLELIEKKNPSTYLDFNEPLRAFLARYPSTTRNLYT
jgi:hypothetical protein